MRSFMEGTWHLVSVQWLFLFVTQMTIVSLLLVKTDLEKSGWRGGKALSCS